MTKFPLYHIIANNNISLWLTLDEAAEAFANGLLNIKFGLWVKERPGEFTRPMTDQDKWNISDRADDLKGE